MKFMVTGLCVVFPPLFLNKLEHDNGFLSSLFILISIIPPAKAGSMFFLTWILCCNESAEYSPRLLKTNHLTSVWKCFLICQCCLVQLVILDFLWWTHRHLQGISLCGTTEIEQPWFHALLPLLDGGPHHTGTQTGCSSVWLFSTRKVYLFIFIFFFKFVFRAQHIL